MPTMLNVPETAAEGEVVEVKILISHPMETGFRTDRDGRRVPRNIIHEVRCEYGGETVFRAELFPAVTANPFLSFFVRAGASGDVTLVWVDEAGEEHREVRPIAVG